MNKLRAIIGVLLLSTIVMAFASVTRPRLEKVESLKVKPIAIVTPVIEVETIKLITKSHHAFLDAIGQRESSGNYKAVNRYGYLGKYQFGRSTLEHLKFNVTQEEFLNNPLLQEKAMQKLLLANKKSLRKQIKKHCGTIVHGIYITESGLLAAAHLGGAGSVRKFLRNGYEFKDGNGTKLTSYMELFAGYTLDLNE